MFQAKFPAVLLCTAMLSCPLPASASNDALNVYADHVGRLNGWLLLPEVVLKHCEIHAPGKATEMRAAFESWRTTHEELIETARHAVDATAPVFAPWLGMTVEQAKEWQRDSATLVVEEMTFWRKARVQIFSMCTNYPTYLINQHSSNKTMALVQESLAELNRARRQQDQPR